MCQVMYSLSKKKVKNLAALNKAKECDQYPYFSRFFSNTHERCHLSRYPSRKDIKYLTHSSLQVCYFS